MRHLFLPPVAAMDQELQRLFLLEQWLLVVFLFGRDLGFLGETEWQDDRDVFGFEPVDDLGGLASADDHGRGPELGGEIEGPVDLVAAVGLPPDRQFSAPGQPESPQSRVKGRRIAPPS